MWPFLVHRRHGPSITTSRIHPRKRIPPPLPLHKKTIPPLAYTHTKKKSLKSAADPIGIRPAKLCVRVVCLLRRCGVSSFLVRRFLFFLFFYLVGAQKGFATAPTAAAALEMATRKKRVNRICSVTDRIIVW